MLTRVHNNVRSYYKRFSKNRFAVWGGLLTIFVVLIAIFSPVLAPYDYRVIDPLNRWKPPSAQNWLGTDDFGRDVFTRLLIGARVSLGIGFSCVALSMSLGAVVGMIAGYYGGRIDATLMRITDVLMTIPSLFLMIAVVSLFGPSIRTTILTISFTSWRGPARVIRANVLALRNTQFIEAARATGARDLRIMFSHVLPNIAAPIIVQSTLFLGQVVLWEAGLSYLGLGAQPPIPSWGNMISEGQSMLGLAWWMSVFPGIAIFMTVLAFNLFGDGLRDAFDPKLVGR